MRPARGVEHPLPPSTEVIERVELYPYSTYGPSWPVLEWTLLTSHGRFSRKIHAVRVSPFASASWWLGLKTHGSVTPHYTISTYVLLLLCCKKHNSLVLAARLRTTTVRCCVHFYTNCTAIPWTVLYTHCLCDFNTSHQLYSSVTSTNSETLHADGLLLLSADTTHLHVIHQQNTHTLLHKGWWDTRIDWCEPDGTSSKAKGQTCPDLWTNAINRSW